MKLMPNNSIRYNINNIAKKPILKNEYSHNFKPINFKSSFEKLIKKGGDVVYTNIGEITEKIDGILGDNFLKGKFQKLNINVDSLQEYTIKDSSIIVDIFKTLKYPFVDLPLDLTNFILKCAKKIPFLSNFADSMLSKKILAKRTQIIEAEKSKEIISNILEAFADKTCLVPDVEKGAVFDIDKCKALFSNKAANNLSKTVKNYNSRDERTLNRLITSTVSAIYGARDFYNISMLQKDNKKDAKRAKKSRFKQEMTRTTISAAMTFFTLGALNKYTKNSLVWTVGTIVGSSLIAEIVSRLINKVSLVPLTPKKAEKIAKYKKAKLSTESQNNNNENSKKNIPFKNKLELNNKTYAPFIGTDGKISPLNMISNSYEKGAKLIHNKTKSNNKKNNSITKIAAIAFGSASLIYLLNYFLRGNFNKNKAITKFITDNQDKLTSFVNGRTSELDSDTAQKLLNIKNLNPKKHPESPTFTLLKDCIKNISKILKNITKKKITYDKNDLSTAINKIKNTEEGQKINELLRKYEKAIADSPEKMQRIEDRRLISGVVSGFKKIFDTAWLVLSAPGALIKNCAEKINFKNNNLYFDAMNKLNNQKSKIDLDGLHKLVSKYKDPNECAKMMKKNARAFSSSSETSKIANYSRAFVTMISSYFFVNDYYNKVLIESEGKNIHEAQEERNERIAHKLSNFVVNGTLMNIFNSVFNKALNNSLIQATIIAGATEMTNEFLVRKSICQPVRKMKSKEEIIKWEEKQTSKKGLIGAWSRFFKKITGKKTLTEKAHIDIKKEKQENTKNV